MQPSGEVGRFEVVNLPSPPADRRRYPTGRVDDAHGFRFNATADFRLILLVLGHPA